MKYGMNKYAEDSEYKDHTYDYPLALFANIPSFAALGLGGYGLSKLLKLKKNWPLALGLPAAYLAYISGKKGNGGLDLYKGIPAVDWPASWLNYYTHIGPVLASRAAKGAYHNSHPGSDTALGEEVMDLWDDAL